MCIPRDAPNPEAAHEWINYILDAEVHASIADYIKYACPNAAAMAYLSEEDRNNPAIYPPQEVLDNLFPATVYDARTDRLMNRLWTELRTGQ